MDNYELINLFGEEEVKKEAGVVHVGLSNEIIDNLIGVKESYFASQKLMKTIMVEESKNNLMENFLKYESDLSYDWFTDYFQQEHSDRKGKKQDFTPDGVVDLMSRLIGETSSIGDVCSGTGGLTIKVWSKNTDSTLYLEEFSDRVLPFLLFNLSIRNVNAVVRHGDSLSREYFNIYEVKKGEKFSTINITEEKDIKVDSVIMNPPYSLKWEHEEEYLRQERFSDYGLAPKARADFAFLLQGLHTLNEGGKMAVILPHGVLFRSGQEQEIRKRLIEKNYIKGIIGLPKNLFLNTAIPTVIIMIEKNSKDEGLFVINAEEYYRTETPINVLDEEHIQKIVEHWQEKKEVDRYSKMVSKKELEKNDYNLNIPRYVSTFIPEPTITHAELIKDFKEIQKDISKTKKELAEAMKELTSDDAESIQSINFFIDLFKGD